MYLDLRHCIDAVWIAFLIVWAIGAFATKQTVRTQSFISRAAQSVFFILAFIFLFKRSLSIGPLAVRFVPPTYAAALTGLVLTVIGVGFAIWARFHLGGNWSGAVTVKQDHQLIRSGPYSLVRHPIYSGIELGLVGTAIAIGEVRGILAAVFGMIGMRMKSRLEENFMTAEFGEEYAQYRKEVKGLIPFVW